MALKKSDLYSSLWAGADELRGGMDASQYKDYVLTLLFVKYVSDKAKADPANPIEVPEGGSFQDLVALRGKPNIGEEINKAIRRLAAANDLQGVINNADFDDSVKLGEGKAKQDRLSRLVGIFQDLDFTGSRAEGDDLLGDAYEYLMRHFATESGKSKGQFYTPAEVSRVLAQLLGINTGTKRNETVYDPTCGSGSLLIKIADAAPNSLTIYGQEMDNATWALARMNMILHGNAVANIRQGNTLADPKFFDDNGNLKTFNFVVANPPFSVKSWTNGVENDYSRFDGYSRPPEKNGDYAFLLHIIKSLNSTGKAAVILPHGVLSRGGTEGKIRREIIKRGLIKSVVGLPANLFYGTGIPACIIVLDKENSQARTGIFLIDASRGFAKDGPKNRLRPRDMHKIVDVFNKQTDIDGYSRMVPLSEIQDGNEYNLNISRYIDSSEPEDIQDLEAHLEGGIPNRDLDALQPYWDAFPTLRSTLFNPLREGYCELSVGGTEIRAAITNSPEYKELRQSALTSAREWWESHNEALRNIGSGTRANDLIGALGETLLGNFRSRSLIDEYAIYEQSMSYWNDVMHDDVSLVVSVGWDEAVLPRPARVTGKTSAGKPKYEDAHLQFGTGVNAARWVMDLLPPELIVARYFADEARDLEKLNMAVDRTAQAIEEYVEENAVEEGPLFDAIGDDGKITSKTAADRLKVAKREGCDREEISALTHVIGLFKEESLAKKAAKEAKLALDKATLAQYGRLDTAEIQSIVIEDKWGATIQRGIATELDILMQRLVERMRLLYERYDETVTTLAAKYGAAEAEVSAHLTAMGVGASVSARTAAEHPTEWLESQLLDLVTIASGQVDPRLPQYRDLPLIAPDHIESGTGQLLAVETAAEQGAISGKYLVEPGDVIYSKIRPYLRKAYLAEFKALCSADMYPLRPKAGVDGRFILNTLLSESFTNFAVSVSMRSGIPKINRAELAEYRMSAPGDTEQQRIGVALESADKLTRSLDRLIAKKQAIKQGMMQELLTGRTRLLGEGTKA
ncbi:type I restriction-modification system subunit M [Streptomyces venetus]|uniref:type I restriction-modification system subunit M n=1 Tax=Streptomyces venetus TaxID=1701086 RepID=UPI003C2BEAC8